MIKRKNYSVTALSLFFALITLLVFSGGCGKKDNTSKTDGKTEKVESEKKDVSITSETPVYIEFKVEGDVTGKMKGWYKDKRSRSEAELNMKGATIKWTSFSDGSVVYSITETGGKKVGMKMNVKSFQEQAGKEEDQIDISTWRDELKKNYDKVGTAEVLGKMCDVYRHKDQSSKMYIYKDYIPMKVETEKMTLTAEKYEIDANISDDMLTPPKDVEYIDMSGMMKGLEKMKDNKDVEGMKEKTKELEEQMKKYSK